MQRKWKWIIALVLILALTLSSVSSVLAYSSNRVRVIIGFDKPPVTTEENSVRAHGGSIGHRFHLVPAMAIQVPERAIPLLQAMRGVSYIELDGQVEILDDTLPWGVDRIDAERVWGGSENATDITPGLNAGAGIKIAIIDTGIDLEHEDLTVVDGVTIYGSTSGGDDDHGHGTHCAGIAAALDNDIGVIGVAPEAELYAVKVLNSSGSGYWSGVANGIEWAVDHGMDIISMSLGSSYGSSLVEDACDAAEAAGVVVVAAAGNSGYSSYRSRVVYPARYESAIAVASTDSSDNRSSFSSTGPEVEIAAPGSSIYSTYYGNSYTTMSGTSMATPHVSGVAALIIASGITDNNEVRLRLRDTADDLGDPGHDIEFGYGLVDADEAATPSDIPPTVSITSPSDDDTVSGTITINANAGDDNGVTQVEFFIDGSATPHATDTSNPYSCSWDTNGVADGPHNITATATDTIAQTTSNTIGVTVDNIDDPPTVAITAPGDGATVLGAAVNITADASDDDSVTQVDFYIDDTDGSGVPLATDTTAPYSCTWDSTAVTDGAHNITAKATDSIAQTNLDTIGVTVDNIDDPPTVSITNPGDGDTVKGTITITADASDDDSVNQVEFFYDSSSIGVDSNGADGWSTDWNTTGVGDGPYDIKATATDTKPQTADSATIGVTVDNTAPAQVSGLTVTPVSSSQLDLDWDANGEPDVDHYNVYRSDTEGGTYSPVDSSGTNSYSNTGLEATTTYYYKVSAVDAVGNEGTQSAWATGTTSEPSANTMHVDSIDMTLVPSGRGRRTYALATVTIVDASTNPVPGATVSGDWQGATSDSDSGITDANGQVTLRSGSLRRPPSGTTYTFVVDVDGVTKDGWTYDADANIETSDSVSVP